MKALALMATLPFFIATPVLAQHDGHPMPEAATPAPKSAPAAPTPKRGAKHKMQTMPADHGGHDSGEMPEMTSPSEGPSEDTGSTPGTSGSAKPQNEMGGMDHGQMDHSQMPGMTHGDMPGMDEEVGQEPAPAPPKDYAADRLFDPAVMDASRAQLRKEHGGETYGMFLLNIGEYQVRNGENGYRWDGEAWYGGDINSIVVKSEGESGASSGVDATEVQALYSRAISPYFDLQAGIRHDFKPSPTRTYATVGFEGLAPYWFQAEGALFLSDKGELLGRLEGTYDLGLTQRWILQPRAEMNLAAEDIPEIGVGSGVANLELGLRLRYEIRREFAPYVGVSFDRKFGGTADFARLRGEETAQTSIVFGARTWF